MTSRDFTADCPLSSGRPTTIQMAHGGGGRRMRDLLEEIFLPAFANPPLEHRHDSAVLAAGAERLAFTTDSYVVRPLFFPGGDIGKLAVCGTVNDLAMAGAVPRWLSAGFVLEEGLDLEVLRRVVGSMRDTARAAGVAIVAGDTKVVDRGKGDGIYVTTAGVGVVPAGVDLRPARVRAGDAVLLSGDLGRHGVAILSVREAFAFEGAIESDCASLATLVAQMLETGADLHCLRDLTRGGLVSALNEIALDAGVGIEVEEAAVPVPEFVRGACEILGLDPLYVANEGRLVAFVPESESASVLARMRAHPQGAGACRIGRVVDTHPQSVEVVGGLGAGRVLDLLSGEQLPRIC